MYPIENLIVSSMVSKVSPPYTNKNSQSINRVSKSNVFPSNLNANLVVSLYGIKGINVVSYLYQFSENGSIL